MFRKHDSPVSRVRMRVLLLTVMSCLMIGADGQLTIGSENYRGINENSETLLSTFIGRLETTFRGLNDRFDRFEESLNILKRTQNELILAMYNQSDEFTRKITTYLRNHSDQLSKPGSVIRVVEQKNEEPQQLCTNNVTRIPNRGCPLLRIANADINHVYLSYVNVTCRHGYLNNANQSWIITQCHDNNGWSPMPTDCTRPFAHDCSELQTIGFTTSGVYTVYVGDSQRPLAVYCDMTTESGGWTVLQRRQDGSVDFYRNWVDYQQGFGDVSGEFWIGNDNIHLLTASKRYKLRFELTAFDGSTAYAEYANFKVGSAAEKYRLSSVGTYSGTAGDSFSGHVGQKFSTKDQDNDSSSSYNCAVSAHGAWWYNACHYPNLNGKYYKTPTVSFDGLCWYHLKTNWDSMKRTEMKITPFV